LKYILTTLKRNEIMQNFIRPLKANATTTQPLISATEIATIFANFESLLNFNKKLLESLNAKSDLPIQDRTIGDVFLELAPMMKMYTEYINNFDQSNHLLQMLLKERPALADYLEVCSITTLTITIMHHAH
jgi:hypothetical protein